MGRLNDEAGSAACQISIQHAVSGEFRERTPGMTTIRGARVVPFGDGAGERGLMSRVRDALLVVATAGLLAVVFVLAVAPRFA